MNKTAPTLPAAAIELAQRGEIIEAIKITREQTGLGLKEAKEAVNAYIGSPHLTVPSDRSNNVHGAPEIPLQAIVALNNGQLIEAIKHTRESNGLGLQDAKQAVERYLEQNPGINSKFKSAASAEFKLVVRKALFLFSLLGLAVLGYQYYFGQDIWRYFGSK